MNTLEARRAAATVLLAAGGLFLVAAPAQATCMVDDKGNQVCGTGGAGPTSGPGSYSGNNGVNNGTAGQLGPDGQPMTAANPPALGPGAAPAAPANEAAVRGTQAHYVAPAPVTVPQANQGNGSSGQSPFEYAPPAPANGADNPAGAADPAAVLANPVTPAAAADADASAAASAAATAAPTASAAPTATATMTERAARPTRTATATATPAAVATDSAASTEAFNPVPMIVAIGAVLGAAGLIWFIPGARASVSGLLRIGRRH